MMNYEIFKEVVAEKFMDYMPEQYQGMRLRVEPVNKVNKVLDGITLVGSGAGRNVSPTLYINHMYEHYLETENLQEVLQSAARRMDMAFKEMPEVGDVNLEGAKDNIVFQVINTLQNEDMLRDMPHREFQDLSIIYRWVVKVDENGIQSSAIRNNLAEQLGMNEEQLFKCAVENTRRIFPPTVKSMNDVIREMFISDGMPAELAEMVSEINMGQVALEDRLSNQVYHYDKDARRLTLATDTPNKRLDGMVAEAQLIYDNGKSR